MGPWPVMAAKDFSEEGLLDFIQSCSAFGRSASTDAAFAARASFPKVL